MGIGFKSVFARFQEARISGWGWNFRYEITQVVGEEYGDVQRDLLGAVVPIWDDAIAAPRHGFTTRFEMRRRTDEGADLESDLARFLPDDDRTFLAILAASGLERLEVDGRVWELGVSEEPDGSLEATALSESENRLWRLFPSQFRPSKDAVAHFLEYRKIQPSEEERDQRMEELEKLEYPKPLRGIHLTRRSTPSPTGTPGSRRRTSGRSRSRGRCSRAFARSRITCRSTTSSGPRGSSCATSIASTRFSDRPVPDQVKTDEVVEMELYPARHVASGGLEPS